MQRCGKVFNLSKGEGTDGKLVLSVPDYQCCAGGGGCGGGEGDVAYFKGNVHELGVAFAC